jgi:4-carboxymuconolactone decarboxylase
MMPRLPAVRRDQLSGDHQRLYDVIVGTRQAGLAGPFSALIHNATIAGPANELHNAFRLNGKLDRRLFEMLVLIVAGEWSAAYAWSVHERLARKAGLAPAIIDAIQARRRPGDMRRDETLIYDLTNELLQNRTVSAQTYEAAVADLGREEMIEAVAAVGFYSMLCGVINAFEIPSVGA